MAKLCRLIRISLWLYLCTVVSSTGLFDRILNEGEPCKESCDKTYPLHTYPNPKHSESCKRGCRFYSLVEFINKTGTENATRDACMASCMEAYTQTVDRYACNIGCSNQVPFKSPSLNTLDATDDDSLGSAEWFSIPMLKSFSYVNNMVDHMSKVMSISWSMYMKQGDGPVVIIQSEPEIRTEFIDIIDTEDKGKDGLTLMDAGDEFIRNKLKEMNKDSDLSPSGRDDYNSPLSDIFFYHRQLSPNEVGASNNDLPVRITVNAYATEEFKSLDWLGCVSKKSGLPRWLLGFVIFVSAMVMVWLCFASSATAPDQHIKPQVLSIYGDGDCVRLEKDMFKFKPLYDKNSEEAELLPAKVHLPSL